MKHSWTRLGRGGLAWLLLPVAMSSAAVVSLTDGPTEVQVSAIGPTRSQLIARAQPVLLRSPASDQLTGCIMMVFDPKRHLFFWSYQATDRSRVPKGGWLSWWLGDATIYADEQRLARFSDVGGLEHGLWFRESTDVVQSIEEGVARAFATIEQIAPEFFGAGAWYLLYREMLLYPILTNTDRQFFILPGHAEALPGAKVTDIERTPSEWALMLQGSNPDRPHAHLRFRHDGSVTSFQLTER